MARPRGARARQPVGPRGPHDAQLRSAQRRAVRHPAGEERAHRDARRRPAAPSGRDPEAPRDDDAGDRRRVWLTRRGDARPVARSGQPGDEDCPPVGDGRPHRAQGRAVSPDPDARPRRVCCVQRPLRVGRRALDVGLYAFRRRHRQARAANPGQVELHVPQAGCARPEHDHRIQHAAVADRERDRLRLYGRRYGCLVLRPCEVPDPGRRRSWILLPRVDDRHLLGRNPVFLGHHR